MERSATTTANTLSRRVTVSTRSDSADEQRQPALGTDPLGIHVTVIEPGFFRTNFMDNHSLARTGQQIGDYTETVGKTRIFAVEGNHGQPGDPAKLAQALLQLANAAKPPLRLTLGTDALKRIAEKSSFVAKETAEWRPLSESTDFKET